MNYFELVKGYYEAGWYTNAQVRVFTERGKITEAQYTEITGEPYNV